MRNLLFCLFLGVFAGGMALAQEAAPTQQASGNAFQETSWEHGNEFTGGIASEVSFSFFNSEGPCDASGDTLNNGWSTGASHQGADSASSFSKAYNEFQSWAKGTTKAEVGAEGLVNQFNEASINRGDEFSSGWGNTLAGYGNFISGTGSVSDSGKAGANGNTAVSLSGDAVSKKANAMTKDSSFAIVTPNTAGGTTSFVEGVGAVGSWIQMGGADQNFSGVAGFNGFANYKASDAGPLSGSLQSVGDSFINLGADFMSAGAHNASSSVVNGGACGGSVCD